MKSWRVMYMDMTKETFEAETYDAVVGTFRNNGVSVAWVNTSAVKSVREYPNTEKAEAIRGGQVPTGMGAR